MEISDFLNSLKKPPAESGAQKPAELPVEPANTVDRVAPPQIPAPQSRKPDASYRHYFHLLKGSTTSAVDEYNFERDGTLVEVVVDDS